MWNQMYNMILMVHLYKLVTKKLRASTTKWDCLGLLLPKNHIQGIREAIGQFPLKFIVFLLNIFYIIFYFFLDLIPKICASYIHHN